MCTLIIAEFQRVLGDMNSENHGVKTQIVRLYSVKLILTVKKGNFMGILFNKQEAHWPYRLPKH